MSTGNNLSAYVNAKYNLGGIIFTIPTKQAIVRQEPEELENGHEEREYVNGWFDGQAVEQLHEAEQ